MRNPNTQCAICQQGFYKRPSELKKSKTGNAYCSSACYGKSCRKTNACTVCGKEILASKQAKTCSRSCANVARKGIRYKQVGRPTKDKVKTRSILKQRLISQRGSCCEICGFSTTQILVPHHIIRSCDGGSDDLENLILICPNCHSLIHWFPEGLPCGVVTRLENG